MYIHVYLCTSYLYTKERIELVSLVAVFQCARVDESAAVQYDFSIGWRIRDQVSLNYKNASYCHLLRFWYKMLMKKNRAKFFSKTLFIGFSVGIYFHSRVQ